MIPKSEREHDRATFNAAEHGYRVHKGLLYKADGTRPITSMGGEWLPQFVAAAFTRVPTYITALDELERDLEQAIAAREQTDRFEDQRGYTNGLRAVLRKLRGEKVSLAVVRVVRGGL